MLILDPKERGILIVDDEDNFRNVLRDLLNRGRGYKNLFTAKSGVEAVSILAANAEKIYLVLLDLVMPQMGGIDVIRHLTNVHTYHVGIIILTGYPDVLAEPEFLKMSSEKILTLQYRQKPFEFAELEKDVELVLKRVHEKRIGHLNMSADNVYAQLTNIEARLSNLDKIPEISKSLQKIEKRHRGLLSDLGLDLLRAIIIAFAIIAVLFFGVGDFIRSLLHK